MIIDKEQIAKAKEKLGDENASIIAELLQLEKYDEKSKKGLCPWHLEDTPSFIYNPKGHCFKCFGCGRNTDIIDAYMHNGLTYIEACEKLFDHANMKISLGEKGVKTKTQYIYPHAEPINDKTKVRKYLNSRKISDETIEKADVREDEHGNVVFNYYDTNDVLTMVKYRPARKIQKGENKTWCQKDADTAPLLFNMNRVNNSQPLLITEGEGDTLAAIESGFSNAVSVPFGAGNYTWIEENFDWLEQFDSIIICSDNDEAGMKMRKECVYRLGSWRTKYVEIPPFHIIKKDDGSEQNVPMKDLNEVLFYEGKEAVLNLLNNATDTGVPSVCDLSDITDIDLDEIDGIKFGIAPVDTELMKLFYGTLNVISGKPGSGKTSLISQLVCQTMEQEKNAWVFSREMPNWMTKSWINYILAGRANIKEYKNSDQSEYYKITPQAKQGINEYYKGKCYVYKDDESNKLDDLLKSMTDSARKYGSKLFVLDNLMTIDLNSNENDELQKQTVAINKLIAFAIKYQVAVVLVAHPRKMPRDCDIDMYDISGTANIANLAHRTIGLRRINKDNPKEQTDKDVELTIIKDRLRGKLNKKIGLYYDVPSRRFYSSPSEFNYQYHWDDIAHTPAPYPHGEDAEIFGTIRKEGR